MSPLKQLLTAPDNLRAVAALAIIADPSRDPEELRKLAPLPQLVALPDGKKRSSYLQRDLVAACYDITAPPPPPEVEERDGHVIMTALLYGPREQGDLDLGRHKLRCFRVLAEGCGLRLQPDTGKRIIDDWLLKGWPLALEFALAGKVAGPYLTNTYLWMSNREILARAIQVGLDPQDPLLIIHCLGFYGCDPNNSYSEPGGRDLVIRQLLELGNRPAPAALAGRILGKADYCAAAYQAGVLAEIEAACPTPWQQAIPGVPPEQVQRAWDDWTEAYEDGESTVSHELLWELRRICEDLRRLIPYPEIHVPN